MLALGRPGRLRGAGFYDYDEAASGSGCGRGCGPSSRPRGDPAEQDLLELQERMLFAEAIESVRCLDEGVLTTVADANIGSIMGIGFPPWTGGVLQYVNGYRGAGAAATACPVSRPGRAARRALRPAVQPAGAAGRARPPPARRSDA